MVETIEAYFVDKFSDFTALFIISEDKSSLTIVMPNGDELPFNNDNGYSEFSDKLIKSLLNRMDKEFVMLK